jgi:DNA ligase-associated metallophosphoesterase
VSRFTATAAASRQAEAAPAGASRVGASQAGASQAGAARSDVPHGDVEVAGAALHADAAGALYWTQERLLLVSDLHLEKGSSFARRGMLLPPYDTPETLARLAHLVARYAPRTVVALGDSFHDGEGAARLSAADRTALVALMRGREWVWISGNHDPDPFATLGGTFAASFCAGPLTFRHEPARGAAAGEIAGHLHPVVQVFLRGRGFRRRCFVGDGRRLVMPAFGAYAGGLNVRHRAFAGLFGRDGFVAHVLGHAAVHAFPGAHCRPD